MRRVDRWAALPALFSAILSVSVALSAFGQGPTAPSRRPELVMFPGGDLTLGGWLWRPDGDGPFPAVLYNHGSEPFPGDKPDIAPLFVSDGYIFFVPHRRGHGRSPGPYIQDQLAAAPRPDRNRLQVALLEAQVADQLAALAFLEGRAEVDPARIAVAGCSYGGIQALLGAEATGRYRAAVVFSPGAQSWQGNPLLQERLVRAVGGISAPLFVLQAENDYSLAPSAVLGSELERLGKPREVRVYPPYGTTVEEGHGGFCFSGGHVWGADVLQFLGSQFAP